MKNKINLNENVKSKIDKLLEENLSEKLKNALKAAGFGALGGSIGAALDVYFNDGHNIQQFIKPVTAWATGGAIGSLLQSANENKKKNIEEALVLDKNRDWKEAALLSGILSGGITGLGSTLMGVDATGAALISGSAALTGAALGGFTHKTKDNVFNNVIIPAATAAGSASLLNPFLAQHGVQINPLLSAGATGLFGAATLPLAKEKEREYLEKQNAYTLSRK